MKAASARRGSVEAQTTVEVAHRLEAAPEASCRFDAHDAGHRAQVAQQVDDDHLRRVNQQAPAHLALLGERGEDAGLRSLAEARAAR